jgi:predicted metal-dependent hydrolase
MMRANFKTAVHEALEGVSRRIDVHYRKNTRARRYILRVTGDGNAAVTIPRGGSLEEAKRFAARHAAWLEERLNRWKAQSEPGFDESSILLSGRVMPLVRMSDAQIALGEHIFQLEGGENLRVQIKASLWRLAKAELPGKVAELALQHGLVVRKVVVRDQRSRWGSCSVSGCVSLNWRLVQVPEFVRDYVIVHELMHLREMNHSARFWKLVKEAFPRTPEAEQWLRMNETVLRRL